MSLCNKISFFEDDENSKLSPLTEFYSHDLTVEKIHEKIYEFQKRNYENEQNTKADLVSKVLNDVIDEICDFLNDKSCSSTSSLDTFVTYLKEFEQQVIVGHLYETVSESLRRQQINEEIKKSLADNDKTLMQLMKSLDKKVVVDVKSSKTEINIGKLKKTLLDHSEMDESEIIERIHNANLKMLKHTKLSHDANVEESEKTKLLQHKYQSHCQKNLVEQKKLMELKFKEEQALQAILIKFDTDVGLRARECENLDAEFEELKGNFELFEKIEWAQQEEVYEYFLKRQIKDRDDRLEEIRTNHAAKVIQKNWRRYQRKVKKAAKKAKK